jgi:hypothetical protein
MIAVTHALLGLALATLSLPVLSAFASAPVVLAAAFVGSLLPDLDIVAEHRRTLHFPVAAPVLAGVVGVVAVVAESAIGALAAVALGAAGLHALSDVFGGSPETEPWNPTSDIAVFNHVLGRWHRARRYVRYSRAPENFGLALCFGCTTVLAPGTGARVDGLVAVVLVVSGCYTLGRKRLISLSGIVGSVVPAPLRTRCPTIRVEQKDGRGSTPSIRFS